MCIWLSCVQITSVCMLKIFGLISKCQFSFGDSREEKHSGSGDICQSWKGKWSSQVIAIMHCLEGALGSLFPPVPMVWIILKILLSQIGLIFSCFNLHSHVVDKCVHYDWQNRKPEHFSPECLGLLSTAAAQPPPQSAVLSCLWLKVVKKDQEKQTLHFPFHSLFREMFKEYFGFCFECPYILFPLLRSCAFAVLAGHHLKGPQGPALSLFKCMRISKKPFQQWNFVQRAERWQSIVSSLRPVMPNAAKRVKWCYWSEHFSEHTVPHQGFLSQLGHLHSFSPYGHLFVLPLPSLCVGCSRTASGKLSVCPSFGWHSVCSVGAPAHTKSLSRAWRPKSAVVDTWVVFAPYSSCCVCVNPWNFTFQ